MKAFKKNKNSLSGFWMGCFVFFFKKAVAKKPDVL